MGPIATLDKCPIRLTQFLPEKVCISTLEKMGFVDEMRGVAMKLHSKDHAREGQKEPDQSPPLSKWEPSIEGYLRFYIDSLYVFRTLEFIVNTFPAYAELRSTGLERTDSLTKDLAWFEAQGNIIPDPTSTGMDYVRYLEEISETDPQGFICHFYNVYFAHSAGGRMIGRKVAQKLSINKDLDFYKWDVELPKLLQTVREKLNKLAEGWTRDEKDHCLSETEKSFHYSGAILRLIIS